ncbi:MAG: RNA methyltransferase [Clostridia bacterium]|nr:RNA methyltransferase [Clostridia bacterium]
MTKDECISRYQAEPLRSRTGATVTMLSKLKNAKYREEYGLYLAEGVKLTEEALACADRGAVIRMLLVSEAALTNDRILLCLEEAHRRGIPLKLASPEVFEKAATEKAPQGIITVLERTGQGSFALREDGHYLLLDTIQDPGNLGTILRSAVAFGADGLILWSCADPTGPKTVRASMGAVFRCPVMVTDDPCGIVRKLKADGHRVLAAALSEDCICAGRADLLKNDCVIIGNEGHGVSQEIIRLCDGVIRIPMQAEAESLNASVAASVLLWEYYRTFGI